MTVKHPPPYFPDHPLWANVVLPGVAVEVPCPVQGLPWDDRCAAGLWQLHRCQATPDAIELVPPVPLAAFRSLHVWSQDLAQWVRPSWFGPQPGQVLATRRER